MTGTTSRYVAALTGGRRPARVAAVALAGLFAPTQAAGARRRVAARAVAAAAALLPSALVRHGARRGHDAVAVWEVARKFGRPEDLEVPDIGVRAQFASARLDPRLGGLLGDSAAAIAAFLADGTGVPAPEVAKAVASAAPLVLGALTRVAGSAEGLSSLLAGFAPEALDDVSASLTGAGTVGVVFRVVEARAAPSTLLAWLASRFRS